MNSPQNFLTNTPNENLISSFTPNQFMIGVNMMGGNINGGGSTGSNSIGGNGNHNNLLPFSYSTPTTPNNITGINNNNFNGNGNGNGPSATNKKSQKFYLPQSGNSGNQSTIATTLNMRNYRDAT